MCWPRPVLWTRAVVKRRRRPNLSMPTSKQKLEMKTNCYRYLILKKQYGNNLKLYIYHISFCQTTRSWVCFYPSQQQSEQSQSHQKKTLTRSLGSWFLVSSLNFSTALFARHKAVVNMQQLWMFPVDAYKSELWLVDADQSSQRLEVRGGRTDVRCQRLNVRGQGSV